MTNWSRTTNGSASRCTAAIDGFQRLAFLTSGHWPSVHQESQQLLRFQEQARRHDGYIPAGQRAYGVIARLWMEQEVLQIRPSAGATRLLTITSCLSARVSSPCGPDQLIQLRAVLIDGDFGPCRQWMMRPLSACNWWPRLQQRVVLPQPLGQWRNLARHAGFAEEIWPSALALRQPDS